MFRDNIGRNREIRPSRKSSAARFLSQTHLVVTPRDAAIYNSGFSFQLIPTCKDTTCSIF